MQTDHNRRVFLFLASSLQVQGNRAYTNSVPVRTQLFSATPNVGRPTRLPHACIAGLVHYHSPEAYQHHMKYGPSLYTTDGDGLRVFIGLRKLAEDLSSATLVWLLFWVEKSDEKGAIADGQTANPRLEALHVATKAEQLAHVKNATKDLHPDFKQIFEDTKEEDMLGSLVVYDRVPVPCPEGPVTLIGDAMHVMTPCRSLLALGCSEAEHLFPVVRGEGGNQAIVDAFELVEKLSATTFDAPQAINTALRTFEHEVIPRAKEAVLSSRNAGEEFGSRNVVDELFKRSE